MKRSSQVAGGVANRSHGAPVLSMLLLVACLVAFPASALAGEAHEYTGVSFGPDGPSGSQQFGGLHGVAVDDVSGAVYVYNGGRIDKFDADGNPVDFASTSSSHIDGVGDSGAHAGQIAVAPAGSLGGTAGNIYVANGKSVKIYSTSGAQIGELSGEDPENQACGVSVDSEGRVLVGLRGLGLVRKYTPSSNPPTNSDQSGQSVADLPNLCSVAVDGAGHVYVAGAGQFGRAAYLLDTLEDPTATIAAVASNSVSSNPVSGDVFIAEQAARGDAFEAGVDQFSSSETHVSRFGADRLISPEGIGASSDGVVYAPNRSEVAIYAGSTLIPDATTKDADDIGRYAATLRGEVGAAGGTPASCVFVYVSLAEYRQEEFQNPRTAACVPAGPFTGTDIEPVTAALTGLELGTQYLYRVIGSSSTGENVGQLMTFETNGAVDLETRPATNVTVSGATLNGTIDPEGLDLYRCVFKYVAATEERVVPCAETPSEIGNGNGAVEVHADLSGLEGGTDYSFQLIAENELGVSKGETERFKTLGPAVTGVNMGPVTETEAVLKAVINPNGSASSYYFEYVDSAEFALNGYANAIHVPQAGEAIGSGVTGVAVEQSIAGLTPETTYHFRVVAANGTGTTVGPERIFTTYAPAVGLPDGRAFEQVSPVDKNGASVLGNDVVGVDYASPDGNSATFYSAAGAGDVEGGQVFAIYSGSRGATGWSTEGLVPASSVGSRMRLLAYTEDLSGIYAIAWNTREPATLYRREGGGQLTTIASGISSDETDGAATGTSFISESADGSKVMFETPAKLTPDAVAGVPNVYLWHQEGDTLDLVSVLPGGAGPPAGGAVGGAYDIWHPESTTKRGGAQVYNYVWDSLSRSGDRAFFTDLESDQLYVRKMPPEGGASTDWVSETQKTNGSGPGGSDPAGPGPAAYLAASADGRYVFFRSPEELTNDSNTGTADQGQDLYRYDVESGELVDLAPHPEGNGAEVLGVAGISEDGTYVYFVARAALADGSIDGKPNLYVWHDSQLTFVSTVGGSVVDERIWLNSTYTGNKLGPKTFRITPDGRTVAFNSVTPHEGFANNGKPEVYRYEYGQSAECVSCNQAVGVSQNGSYLSFYESEFVAAEVQFNLLPRNLSENGKRLFFQSGERLVGGDLNNAVDVYEWEAAGSGSCTKTAHHGGCLFLISSGTSPQPSRFSDASANGDDVFFFTSEPLVGQDKDELQDLYDARVDGGLAGQNPPSANPCASAEACRGLPSPDPGQAPVGSATFSGPGNPPPQKTCKKKCNCKKKKCKKKKRQHKHKTRAGGKRR
jgi:hypothetical protein